MEARRPIDPLAVAHPVHPLLQVLADREWIDDGACRDQGELFFAPFGEHARARRRREATAKELCLSCSVMERCREAGRRNHENGLWGGETEEERALAGYPPRGILRRGVARARRIGLALHPDIEDGAA